MNFVYDSNANPTFAQTLIDVRSAFSDIQLNVLAFGADPTGVADSAPAINSAIQTMRTTAANGTVFIPAGTYKISSSLVIESAMILKGVGGQASGAGTQLKPDAGVTCIKLASGPVSPNGGNASLSSVRDLTIRGPVSYLNWMGPAADGIFVNSNGVHISDVYIYNMRTHGINVTSSLGGNANTTTISNATIYYCGGSGIHYQGGDANAGASYNCSIVGCADAGIDENGFLGNTHVRAHTEANITNGFRATGLSNYSTWIGCYAESDQTNLVNYPSVVFGGNWTNSGTAIFDSAGGRSRLRVNSAFEVDSSGTASFTGYSKPYTGYLGSAKSGASNLLEFGNSLSGLFSLRYGSASYHQGFMALTLVGQEIFTSYMLAGYGARLVESGVAHRFIDPGKLVFRTDDAANYENRAQGFYIGSSRVSSSLAPPNYGDWGQGDIVFRLQATAGENVGWVCTKAGTFAGTYTEGRTASTSTLQSVVLNSPSAVLRPGNYISVNGVRTQILSPIEWTPSTYMQNDVYSSVYRTNAGNLYALVSAGTTGTTTGPTGTGAGISDGAATWKYVGPADRTLYVSVPCGTAGPGLAVAYAAAEFQEFGLIAGGIPSSVAVPGAATQNTPRGRVAIPAGTSSVTVTNARVTSSSLVFAQLQSSDGTLKYVLRVVPGNGSFQIVGNANATAAVTVAWRLEE